MVLVSTVDEVLPYIGELGLSQVLIMVILSLLMIPVTFQYLITYFIAHNPPWRCKANSTSCLLTETIRSTNHPNYTYRCDVPREEWEFMEPDSYSIVTQFGLYCDNEYLIFVATTVFFVGMAIGSILFGWMSDKYGRKRLVVPCTVSALFVAFLSSFSPVFWVFTLTRFLLGFLGPGTTLMFFIIASEMVGPKYRPLTGMTLWFFFTLSLVIVGIVAMYVRTWKMLMIYSTAPYLLLLPLLFYIPESLRWLHVTGRLKEAHAVINNIAAINGRKMQEPINLLPTKCEEHKVNPLLLFKGMRMSLKTVNLGFAWMVNGLVYYGISLAASDLTGEMYRDYILSSLVEFPAAVFGILFSMYLGRKYTTIVPMFLGGIFCALVATVEETQTKGLLGVRLTFGLLGKFFLTLAYDVIYTWTVELFPTQIRTEAMGFVQITSRLGGGFAPWIAKGLQKFDRKVPFIVMGLIAIIGAILLYFLPETKGQKTSELMEREIDSREALVPENELTIIAEDNPSAITA